MSVGLFHFKPWEMNSGLLKQKKEFIRGSAGGQRTREPGKGPKSVCGRNSCREDTAVNRAGPGRRHLHLGYSLAGNGNSESPPLPLPEAGCSSTTAAGTLARVDYAQALLLCISSSPKTWFLKPMACPQTTDRSWRVRMNLLWDFGPDVCLRKGQVPKQKQGCAGWVFFPTANPLLGSWV